MIYHPIANLLVQILEQRIIRYTKDFIEICYIQSASGTAEKFASISVATFAKYIKQDLKSKFYGTLFTSTILNTLEEDQYDTHPMRLLFNPMDSFTNFSRGIPNFGASFLLQEDNGGKINNLFSLVYLFQTQEIIYSDGMVNDIRGRNLKPVLRKNLKFGIVACNTESIKTQNIHIKFGHIQSTNSIITDIHHLAKGKIDAISYIKIPVLQMLPIQIIAKTMMFDVNQQTSYIIAKDITKQTCDVMWICQ